MKRILLISLSFLILLVACSNRKANEVTKEARENKKLISKSVSDIDYSSLTIQFSKYEEITEQTEIQEILDFINQLETIEIKQPTPLISDDCVSINFIFNNDTKDIRIDISSEYIFYNNIYYTMNKETYQNFQKLCYKIIKNKYTNALEYDIISGKVISLSNTSSDGSVSCYIQDNFSNTYEINCSDADIYDIYEFKWLILHENDYIEVIYEKSLTQNDYKAKVIFIVPQNK